MKKAIAIKLNDHYAKLVDRSCPSHHSLNVVIPYTCGLSGIRELHNLIVRGICISHEESNSNKTK